MDTSSDHIKHKDELTGDILIADHEYDGIQELDNKLPGWWLWLFYITIIWAVIYMVNMFILDVSDLQAEEYAYEMKEAALKYKASKPQQPGTAELVVLTDEASMTKGKAIYDLHCSVCHLSKGEGLVGPNFTDKYWIHGGSLEDIIEIINVGVPEKGMISWKQQLSPEQILQVSSYILSMQGTNPPNQKEPQGDIYEPEG